MSSQFPAIKATKLIALLRREPLAYEIVRQKGSHRKLRSRNGHPDIGFSFHDGVTLPGGLVRKVLVGEVGLSEDEARRLL